MKDFCALHSPEISPAISQVACENSPTGQEGLGGITPFIMGRKNMHNLTELLYIL